MVAGESMVSKLQFNVAKKNLPSCSQPYSILMYIFYVYTIDKEEKIDYIEKFIQKHDQAVIDVATFNTSDAHMVDVMSNNDIKTMIKSFL